MKIYSTFKDFYDHVAQLYGSGDASCLYIRHRLTDRVGKDGDRHDYDTVKEFDNKNAFVEWITENARKEYGKISPNRALKCASV